MNKPAFLFDDRGILDKYAIGRIGFVYYKIGIGE